MRAFHHAPCASSLLSPRRGAVVLATLLWVTVLALGFRALSTHALTPGVAAEAPDGWPPTSRLPGPRGRGVLVLFAHSFCSCTRATLAQLERVLAHGGSRVDAHVPRTAR